MLAHHSHVQIEAKRKALDALAEGTKPEGYVTKNVNKRTDGAILSSHPQRSLDPPITALLTVSFQIAPARPDSAQRPPYSLWYPQPHSSSDSKMTHHVVHILEE
jgi:hypothetical protein